LYVQIASVRIESTRNAAALQPYVPRWSLNHSNDRFEKPGLGLLSGGFNSFAFIFSSDGNAA
jgi:hypothetical protein